MSKLEEEINDEWRVKCDKQLVTAQDRHARALQGVKEEKEELEQKVTELESKVWINVVSDRKRSSNIVG